MKTPVIRVSLAFCGNTSDDTKITFSRNVHARLYAITTFANPPVTAAELLARIDAFADAKAAQIDGGKIATASKNNRRDELMVPMKKLANFVQESSENDLALLLSSGFEAVSTSRASYPLAKPAILRIVAGMTGEAQVTLSTQSIARGCEIRVAEIGPDGAQGEFRAAVFSTSSRNVSIRNLLPGTLFAYQGRTLGGSTTYSDWSDVIIQRAA